MAITAKNPTLSQEGLQHPPAIDAGPAPASLLELLGSSGAGVLSAVAPDVPAESHATSGPIDAGAPKIPRASLPL
jgi:hypothetical protein